MNIVGSIARGIWTVAKLFWLTIALVVLVGYAANILPTPVKDFSQGFTNSTMGWLFFGPYHVAIIITLVILLVITITAGIIASRYKSVETDAPKPATVATVQRNKGNTTLIQHSDGTVIIPNNTGTVTVQQSKNDQIKQTPQHNTEVLHNYLRSIINTHQGLSPTGISHSQALISVSVPLNDIFIHLHAVSDRPLYDMPDEQKKLLEELETLRQHDNLETGDLEEQAQQRRAALWQSQLRQGLLEGQQRRNIVIEDVLKGLQTTHPVAVILGTPGAGKSTTMRWLALQMARASLNANYQLPEGLSPTQIPLLIRISDYAQLLNVEDITFHGVFAQKAS